MHDDTLDKGKEKQNEINTKWKEEQKVDEKWKKTTWARTFHV